MAHADALYLVFWDAIAVIGDADQMQSPSTQFDANITRACVQRILNQLFDYRSWTLDDFTGGNPFRYIRRQRMQWCAPYRHALWSLVAIYLAHLCSLLLFFCNKNNRFKASSGVIAHTSIAAKSGSVPLACSREAATCRASSLCHS